MMTTRKKWLWVLLAGILSLSLVAAACGDDDDDAAADDAADHDDDADMDSFDVEVTVDAQDLLKFEPSEIRVKTGERVRLVLDNEESTALHDFTIEKIMVHDVMMEGAEHGEHSGMSSEFDLHIAAEPGEHGALMFTAMEAGEYTFYCTVPGHREAGMEGTLVVEG